MEVYPRAFPKFPIIQFVDARPISQRGVVWRKFKDHLWDHFYKYHHKSGKPVVLYQKYSALEIYPLDVLAQGEKDPNAEIIEKAPLSSDALNVKGIISPLAFKLTRVGYLHNKGWIKGEDADETFSRQVQFFTPLFIWEFTKAKKQLVEIDAKLQYFWNVVNSVESAISDFQKDYKLTELPAFPSTEGVDPFALGTAMEIRMQEVWQGFLDEQRRILEEELVCLEQKQAKKQAE